MAIIEAIGSAIINPASSGFFPDNHEQKEINAEANKILTKNNIMILSVMLLFQMYTRIHLKIPFL